MLKRGMSDSEVEESRRRVFLNQRMFNDKDRNNRRIEWSPDNITLLKEDAETTVTQYYRDAHGIELVRDGHFSFTLFAVCS